VSLKSTAKAGKNGNGLKDTDFKYNRNTYWLTSRETPDIVWIEQLGGQDEAVRSYVVRDKEDILVDMQYLDARDSFDSFLTRWRSKTIVKEYGQARLRAAMRGSGAERVYVKVVEERPRDAGRTYN